MIFDRHTPLAISSDYLPTLSRLAAKINAGEVPAEMFEEEDYQGVLETGGDGVGIIRIDGALLPEVPKLFRAFGVRATSYQGLQVAIERAEASPEVREILFLINSPGGAVQGLTDVTATMARVTKPMQAYAFGMVCSAAYWIASQTDRITTTPDAEVGSIGVITAGFDYSRAYEAEGVRPVVISSGVNKGTFFPGTEVTAEQVAPIQRQVDLIAKDFVQAVGDGRGMPFSDAAQLADGRAWHPIDALALGLIDAIATQPEFFDTLKNPSNAATVPAASKGAFSMSQKPEPVVDPIEEPTEQPAAAPEAEPTETTETTDAPEGEPEPTEETEQPSAPEQDAATAERARFAELKAAFQGDLEFAAEQFEKGASLLEAKAAYADVLRERLASASPAHTGAKAVPFAESASGNQGDFMALVHAYAEENKTTKTEAVRACSKAHPDLYAKFIQN